jgi:hypothetical protein
MQVIDQDAVLTLARAQGQDWVDAATAQRIAAAATTAVQAVAAVGPGVEPALLEQAAGDFAAMLEVLAEAQS